MTKRLLRDVLHYAYYSDPEETKAMLSSVFGQENFEGESFPCRKLANELFEILKDCEESYYVVDAYVDLIAFMFAKAVELSCQHNLNRRVVTWYSVDYHGVSNGEWAFWFTVVDAKTDRCLLMPDICWWIRFRRASDFAHKVQEIVTAVRLNLERR
jgi:hypothetical protein